MRTTNHHHHQHEQQHHAKHTSNTTTTLSESIEQVTTDPVESVQGYVLFISNIDRNIDAETLTDTLSDYGKVISLHYELSRRTGLPIGLALVKYANLDQAKEALEGLRGKRLGSKVVQCDWCFKQPPQVVQHIEEENQEEEESTITTTDIESSHNLSAIEEQDDHSEDKRKREQNQLTTENTEPPLKKVK